MNWKLPFLVFSLTTILHSAEYTAIGTVYPQYKTTLSPIVSGKVQQVLVDIGDHVTQNAPLAILDQDFFKIALSQSVFAQEAALLELEDAQRNYDRMKKLYEMPEGDLPCIPKKKYEEASSRYDQAKISLSLATENVKKAQKSLEESIIKAPYTGVITKRYVDIGETVSAAPPTKMLEILSLSSLYVEFSLPQQYSHAIHVGDQVSISIDGSGLKILSVPITRIYPDIDPATRSLRCRVLLENPEEAIQPGALAHITINI